MNRVVIGTRGSPLALRQAHWAQQKLLDCHPGLVVEVEVIQTRGDRESETPLPQMGGKAVWTRDIEIGLLEGRIDLAVHSLKDLPTCLPDGLVLGAVSPREDVRDVIVGCCFEKLPEAARIGTGSLRRQAQLLHIRPDLNMAAVRGNVETRLKKLETGEYQALILAAAGLIRLGLKGCVSEFLDVERCLPAPGQAALGFEIRENDFRMGQYVMALDHVPTNRAVLAERSMLAALGGGCRAPIGALAVYRNGALDVTGMVATRDGRRLLRETLSGKAGEAACLGRRLAERLRMRGADEILGRV